MRSRTLDRCYRLAVASIHLTAALLLPGLPDGWWVGQQQTSTEPTAESWVPLVYTYFEPDDVDRALAVIECESGGDPNAKNPNSTASGLFQHLASMWPERSVAAGWSGHGVFEPEANVAVAAWLVYDGGGWSHWYASVHCWDDIEGSIEHGQVDLMSDDAPRIRP